MKAVGRTPPSLWGWLVTLLPANFELRGFPPNCWIYSEHLFWSPCKHFTETHKLLGTDPALACGHTGSKTQCPASHHGGVKNLLVKKMHMIDPPVGTLEVLHVTALWLQTLNLWFGLNLPWAWEWSVIIPVSSECWAADRHSSSWLTTFCPLRYWFTDNPDLPKGVRMLLAFRGFSVRIGLKTFASAYRNYW